MEKSKQVKISTKKGADIRQRAALHTMLSLDEEYNDLSSYIEVEPTTADMLSAEMDRVFEGKGILSPAKIMQVLQYDVQGYSPALISSLMSVPESQIVKIKQSDAYKISKEELLNAVVSGARKYMEVATLKAVKTLVECLDSHNEKIRLSASQDLLNRAGLQATQQIELTTSVHNFEGLSDKDLEEIMKKESGFSRRTEVVQLVSDTTNKG